MFYIMSGRQVSYEKKNRNRYIGNLRAHTYYMYVYCIYKREKNYSIVVIVCWLYGPTRVGIFSFLIC